MAERRATVQKDPQELDHAVRLEVYRFFLERQRPPTAHETAETLALPVADTEASYERLARARILVLAPGTHLILMAMPLSAVPTAFRVETPRGSWWANCAWDAFGIPAMLTSDARIVTWCADCNSRLSVQVDLGVVSEPTWVSHFAVPAAQWWDDIGFF